MPFPVLLLQCKVMFGGIRLNLDGPCPGSCIMQPHGLQSPMASSHVKRGPYSTYTHKCPTAPIKISNYFSNQGHPSPTFEGGGQIWVRKILPFKQKTPPRGYPLVPDPHPWGGGDFHRWSHQPEKPGRRPGPSVPMVVPLPLQTGGVKKCCRTPGRTQWAGGFAFGTRPPRTAAHLLLPLRPGCCRDAREGLQ